MFGRKGSNNPVEQKHAVQLKDRGQNPFHLANAWCDEVTKVEGKILKTAQTLKDDDAILTPWAGKQLEDAVDGMVNVLIGEEVIIDPAEAAMVTEEVAPNDFV